MRCCLICISNMRYYSGDISEVLTNDIKQLQAAFRARLRPEDLITPPAFTDLNLIGMASLNQQLRALGSSELPDERPSIEDGDLVVVWVAGHGIASGGGTALLPVDAGTADAPLRRAQAWVGNCSIEARIMNPLQAINPNGVVHVVMNIFCEQFDWSSPTVNHASIAGRNFHVLFGCADSTQSLIGDRSVNDQRVSLICYHYCQALLADDGTTLEEACQQVVREVSEETCGQLIPHILHALAKPEHGSHPTDVEQLVWRRAAMPAAVHVGAQPSVRSVEAAAERQGGWSLLPLDYNRRHQRFLAEAVLQALQLFARQARALLPLP